VAEQPKHGYQIEQDITTRGMREWTEIGFSSIYYVLNKLEADSWLASQPGEAQPAAAGLPAATVTTETSELDHSARRCLAQVRRARFTT